MKNKKILIPIIIFIVILVLIIFFINKSKTFNYISDISYSFLNKDNNIVYLLENNEYIHFIVSTNNYNGKTLLLRKNTLTESRRYNEYIALYENSEIDNWLNKQYINQLAAIKDNILESDIIVTDECALGVSANKTKIINRKFFYYLLMKLV